MSETLSLVHLLGHGNTLIIYMQPDIIVFRKAELLLLFYFLFKCVLNSIVCNSVFFTIILLMRSQN